MTSPVDCLYNLKKNKKLRPLLRECPSGETGLSRGEMSTNIVACAAEVTASASGMTSEDTPQRGPPDVQNHGCHRVVSARQLAARGRSPRHSPIFHVRWTSHAHASDCQQKPKMAKCPLSR